MRRAPLIAFIFLIVTFSTIAEDMVSIYGDYQSQFWGRSDKRSHLITPQVADAWKASTVHAGDGGYLTGVLYEQGQADQLILLIKEQGSVRDGEITLTMIHDGDEPIIEWNHEMWDARYQFQLLKAPKEIFTEIARVYATDPYNGGLVDREYRDNYMIKIIAGEDLLDFNGILSFGEALIGATILGDDFQPLYGFKDGRGVLSQAGLLRVSEMHDSMEDRSMNPSPMVETEPMESRMMANFIHRVSSLPGSFPENLYVYTRTICSLIPEDDDSYVTPDQFLMKKEGSNRDFALFFYHVLDTHDFEVRMIVVRSMEGMDEQHIVTFRKGGSPLWGLISQEFYTGQRFSTWPRIPSLLYQQSVEYQELQPLRIMREELWSYSDNSQWIDSFY